MRVYEYPAFESKTKKVPFHKGSKIEERWESGFYKKYIIPSKIRHG
jgi:hypothetical protein